MAKSSGRSSGSLSIKRRFPYLAVCIDNRGNEASLLVGKVYQVIKPEQYDHLKSVRVIDEDGEDYLYAAAQFVPVDLPPRARKAIVAAAAS